MIANTNINALCAVNLQRRNMQQADVLSPILKESLILATFVEKFEGLVAKFYCNFKEHKEHQPNTGPPPHPIISVSNSITKNIGIFIEHYIKQLANQHHSYLQDSPDFLREIKK